MKKLGIMLLPLLFSATLQADIAASVGVGKTRHDAVYDALRSALENEGAVFVDSVSLVEGGRVVSDRLMVASHGIIRGYEEINVSRVSDNEYVATLRVDVDKTLSTQQRAKNVSPISSQKVLELNASADALAMKRDTFNGIYGNPARLVQEGYTLNYEGYEVTDVVPGGVRGHYLVRISVEKSFWDRYQEALKIFSTQRYLEMVKANHSLARREPYALGGLMSKRCMLSTLFVVDDYMTDISEMFLRAQLSYDNFQTPVFLWTDTLLFPTKDGKGAGDWTNIGCNALELKVTGSGIGHYKPDNVARIEGGLKNYNYQFFSAGGEDVSAVVRVPFQYNDAAKIKVNLLPKLTGQEQVGRKQCRNKYEEQRGCLRLL